MIVSVDPGLRGSGVAIWDPSGKLAQAAYIKGSPNGQRAEAWKGMADAIWHFVFSLGADSLVIELPKVYHERSKQKGDQGDLIQLAAVVGACTSRNWSKSTVYLPAEWKKQVPKDIMQRRTEKALRPEERRLVELPCASLAHNVWDAVALGLYHLRTLRSTR